MTQAALEWLAEDALLLRFGDGIDMATNARVHAAARALRDSGLQGITDIAPAYATLLLRFDPSTWSGSEEAAPLDRIMERLRSVLDIDARAARTHPASGAIGPLPPHPTLFPEQKAVRGRGLSPREGLVARIVEIPVCYGGDYGPDVDAVAEHAQLSGDEVIARHAAAEYTVAMLGFAPGFPYLLGLDPVLHVPRRRDPRTRVPAGSVAIGGAQTGIYPCGLPGGWQLIGRTPRVLFDPRREPPCLLAPGDRVRFRAIDADAFARLAEGSA